MKMCGSCEINIGFNSVIFWIYVVGWAEKLHYGGGKVINTNVLIHLFYTFIHLFSLHLLASMTEEA